MIADAVIAALCLPANARVGQRVPKKLLVENGAPTAADKSQINDGIEELLWLAALKPATIGVPAYRDDIREYVEIVVLSLTLRSGAKAPRVTELIHRAIPYPVFLVQSHSDGLALSLAHLRCSQGQAAQTVLDGPLITASAETQAATTREFLASLALATQPRQHLFALYQGWIDCFEAHAAAKFTGKFALAVGPAAAEQRHTALAEHERLLREITVLRAQAAKEKQLNRRVELNMKLKQLDSQLAEAARNL